MCLDPRKLIFDCTLLTTWFIFLREITLFDKKNSEVRVTSCSSLIDFNLVPAHGTKFFFSFQTEQGKFPYSQALSRAFS